MRKMNYSNPRGSILISYEKQTPPLNMPRSHFHDSYEMYYLLSGERYYFIKDKTYRILKGNLVFIDRYDLHRTLDADITSWERILINFKPEFLLSDDAERIKRLVSIFNASSSVLSLTLKEQSIVEDLLFKMLGETDSQEAAFEEMIAAYLIQLLSYIKRLRNINSLSSDSCINYIHKNVSPIIHYINTHYKDPLSLDLLAKLFYMSPYYLCKVFKKSTGFTFIEYLNQLRVKEAQTLLRDSGLNVTEVAEKVGFGSVSQFGRVFKEISGVSPLKYRKQTSF